MHSPLFEKFNPPTWASSESAISGQHSCCRSAFDCEMTARRDIMASLLLFSDRSVGSVEMQLIRNGGLSGRRCPFISADLTLHRLLRVLTVMNLLPVPVNTNLSLGPVMDDGTRMMAEDPQVGPVHGRASPFREADAGQGTIRSESRLIFT